MILFWESVTIRQAPWSVIFILGTFIFTIFIAVSEYFGMYTPIITIPKYETPPIESLEQLWRLKDVKWMSDYPSTTEHYMIYFRQIEDIEGRLHTLLNVTDGDLILKALTEVKENKGKVVYFQTDYVVKHYIDIYRLQEGTELKFYFSKEKFDLDIMVLYYRASCFFSEHLNRAILRILEMPFEVLMFDEAYVVDMVKTKLREIPPRFDYGLIKLQHLVTAAIIIAGAFALSLVTLVVEFISTNTWEFRKRIFEVTRI